jgi:type IV secretion system protein VirB10
MSDRSMDAEPLGDGNRAEHGHGDEVGHGMKTLSPLPGEPGMPDVAVRRRIPLSGKGLLSVGLLMLCVVGASAFSIQRFAASGKRPEDTETKRVGDRPAAASTEPRRLEMPALPAASATAATTPRIPALIPTAEESAEPIGVRRTGQASSTSGHLNVASPEDAPVLLVSVRPGVAPGAPGLPTHRHDDTDDPAGADASNSAEPVQANDPLASTTRSLQGYQRQLQGMLDSLNRRTAAAAGSAIDNPGAPHNALGTAGLGALGAPVGSPFGSATTRVTASMIGNRSLTLPKGTAFTCALMTKVISATAGLVACQVQRNVFSDDGRVLLVERGSHLDGDYRISSVKPGTVRIPVIWTRIRTPHGVVVDVDSPGTGPLGEGGIDGYVDNRWVERIGAALLLSLIDDSVQMVIQEQANSTGANGQANTVVLPSTTANTNKLAEKVLDSTINIPPLIYQNQGGIVGIVVAHDVDFSSVYALLPSAMVPGAEPSHEAASGPAK